MQLLKLPPNESTLDDALNVVVLVARLIDMETDQIVKTATRVLHDVKCGIRYQETAEESSSIIISNDDVINETRRQALQSLKAVLK